MTPNKDYVTKKELATLMSYEEQTISNLIWKGVFKEGVHFFRTSKRHVLFHWPAVERLIRREEGNDGQA